MNAVKNYLSENQSRLDNKVDQMRKKRQAEFDHRTTEKKKLS